MKNNSRLQLAQPHCLASDGFFNLAPQSLLALRSQEILHGAVIGLPLQRKRTFLFLQVSLFLGLLHFSLEVCALELRYHALLCRQLAGGVEHLDPQRVLDDVFLDGEERAIVVEGIFFNGGKDVGLWGYFVRVLAVVYVLLVFQKLVSQYLLQTVFLLGRRFFQGYDSLFSLLDLLLGQFDQVLGGYHLFAVELAPFSLVLFSESNRYPRHFANLFLARLAVATAHEVAGAHLRLWLTPDIISSILLISRERIEHVSKLSCSFTNNFCQFAKKAALIRLSEVAIQVLQQLFDEQFCNGSRMHKLMLVAEAKLGGPGEVALVQLATLVLLQRTHNRH